MDPTPDLWTVALCHFTGQHPTVDGDVTDRYATQWIVAETGRGVYQDQRVAVCSDHAAALPGLVEAVKAHATAHYNDGGWDVVVECWDDQQIAEQIVQCAAGDATRAVDAFRGIVDVWADRQADARNSAF